MLFVFPVDDPIAFVKFVHEKVKALNLPADLDLTPIFNVLHGQLEAMGMPGEGNRLTFLSTGVVLFRSLINFG